MLYTDTVKYHGICATTCYNRFFSFFQTHTHPSHMSFISFLLLSTSPKTFKFELYTISAQTLTFYLHHVILNDGSCQWNTVVSFIAKKSYGIMHMTVTNKAFYIFKILGNATCKTSECYVKWDTCRRRETEMVGGNVKWNIFIMDLSIDDTGKYTFFFLTRYIIRTCVLSPSLFWSFSSQICH